MKLPSNLFGFDGIDDGVEHRRHKEINEGQDCVHKSGGMPPIAGSHGHTNHGHTEDEHSTQM